MRRMHEIVLVGGGHTHVQVLRAFAQNPQPGARLTLVSEQRLTPYSGMLPGHIAGAYSREDMHIDLERLARVTGTRFIEASATGLDRANRRVMINRGERLPYDTLSLNLGITPDLTAIAGAERFGIAVKPISRFLDKLDALLAMAHRPEGPRRFAIIGGGAAGIELAFALQTRLKRDAGAGASVSITLLASSGLVPTLSSCVQRKARAALARQGITVLDDFRAAEVYEGGVTARDGRKVEVDAVLISTAARAPGWFAATDLPLAADGSVKTQKSLAVLEDEAVFAVGDCASVVAQPRPKAGVFAVRQGETLIRNLRHRVMGHPLEGHEAQAQFLTILMAGEGNAIAGKGGWLCLEGRLIWHWKDAIDRRFMRRFSGFRA